jgi:hypothetical protein
MGLRWLHPREALGVALLIATASPAAAEDALKVTKLRTEKVVLYDCADGTKKGEYARKDFQGPWPIVQGSPPPPGGLLRVQVGDSQYCVRAYAVEATRPVMANPECGAEIAALQPRSASTRGLGGDGCGK